MAEYPYKRSKLNFPIAIFLIGLVLFVIGTCWYLRVYIGFFYELEIERSNLEDAFFQGIYTIGMISIIFGIASFLYAHTIRIVPLKGSGLYQLIIIISFVMAIIFEIISRVLLYFTYEDIGNHDTIMQIYRAMIVGTVTEIGMIIMLLFIFMFILKLHNLDKFHIIPEPPRIQ